MQYHLQIVMMVQFQVSEDGNKEERCWKDGMLEGPASVEGVNGDRLEFTYKAGVR